MQRNGLEWVASVVEEPRAGCSVGYVIDDIPFALELLCRRVPGAAGPDRPAHVPHWPAEARRACQPGGFVRIIFSALAIPVPAGAWTRSRIATRGEQCLQTPAIVAGGAAVGFVVGTTGMGGGAR